MTVITRENFEHLESQIAEALRVRGFSRESHEYNGAFGSHYVDFVCSGHAYRLIGDGRESAVFLDYSPCYYEPIPHRQWRTLLHKPFPSSFNRESLAAVSNAVVIALAQHLVGSGGQPLPTNPSHTAER